MDERLGSANHHLWLKYASELLGRSCLRRVLDVARMSTVCQLLFGTICSVRQRPLLDLKMPLLLLSVDLVRLAPELLLVDLRHVTAGRFHLHLLYLCGRRNGRGRTWRRSSKLLLILLLLLLLLLVRPRSELLDLVYLLRSWLELGSIDGVSNGKLLWRWCRCRLVLLRRELL